MSIAKATGQLGTGYPDEFGGFPGREFHGPLAIPIATTAIALFGAVESSNAQNQAKQAQQQLLGQEEQTIGQEQGIAGQIAGQPIDLSGITRAGQSGIETLKNSGGGIANIGAVVKQLLGTNQESAQKAALGQKTTNLNTAAGILGGTNSSLNQLGTQAGAAASAGGNPWASAAGTIGGAWKSPSSAARGGVVTGPGSTGGGDVNNPASAGFPANVPGSSGFGDPTGGWGIA